MYMPSIDRSLFSILLNIYDVINIIIDLMHITKCELSSYVLGKTLGKGTFGKVKLAMHKITGQPVAIKILQKSKIKDVTDVQRVSRELHILKITQHSSIAQMYEIIQTQLNIFIVMEYAPKGEFFDYIMDGRIKTQQQAHHYFVQIVSGLEYLHKLRISHRDIKPENMLLDDHFRLKIVDFGLSNMYKQGQLLLTACGSPCYASPEMIKGEQYDPQLTDVWSLGVVLFSMIFAKLPFQDDNTSVLYGKIKSGLYVIDKRISPQLKDLLSKLLCVKPKNRLNILAIKQHPWYKREKMCKCYGIVVGFENAPLDESILKQMEDLGYNPMQTKRYLQNNIRNQVTTAYYLLMKKYFRMGQPSFQDISNQNFNKKSLIPKGNKINSYSAVKTRHQSFDFNSPQNKETLQVEQYIFSAKKLKKINQMFKKQRNCISQMKSEDYDNYKTHMKSFEAYKTNNINQNIFKKTVRDQLQIKNRKQSPGRLRKTQNSQKSIAQKRKSLKNNISINVYINNAKIQTPSKKKMKTSNSKLQNELVQIKNPQNFLQGFKMSNKRLKTEVIDRSTDAKGARRYQNLKQQELESKSLQKSNELSILQGTFWKKRSTNITNKVRQHTTQSRNQRVPRLKR